MNHGYRKIRQGSDWSSTATATATATTKKKKRFAKPGCGFRAINYRDRLGRFARQKVSGYLGYIEEKREGGSRYIPDVLKVLWDLVELDKFVGPSPRGQHRLGVDLLRTLPLVPKTEFALPPRASTIISNLRHLVAMDIGKSGDDKA